MIEEQVERIRAQVGSERVLCALSGGVDSAVAALLVYKAVGDQLTCVFVNNGLLRKEEPERVLAVMHGNLDMNIRYVDATERFLAALRGVLDPEEKAAAKADWEAHRTEREAKMLERFDANHNGVLDPEEKEAARKEFRARREQGREQHQAKLLEKFDTNHNGKIDPEERQAMQAQREARRAEMLKKYDTDGDGKLSDSEREALRKDMRAQHQERENR